MVKHLEDVTLSKFLNEGFEDAVAEENVSKNVILLKSTNFLQKQQNLQDLWPFRYKNISSQ